MSSSCTAQGCHRETIARGWCTKHYARWKRNGDPEQANSTAEDRYHHHKMDLNDGFWDKVEKTRQERIMGV